MDRRLHTIFGLAAAATIVLIAGTLLLLPGSAPAQKAPEVPAEKAPEAPAEKAPAVAVELPAGYAGAETCKACHDEAWQKFSRTKMGRLFLFQARNTKESLACENCHGPGRAHAEAGGGKGVGGLITFAKNDPT